MTMDNDGDWEKFAAVNALSAAEVGVWSWNSWTNEVRWSSTLERIYGLEPGAFPGSYEAFQQLIHPDDRPYAQDNVRQAMENDKKFRMEHRILWPDGAERWVEGRGEPYHDKDGRFLGMMGTSIDITERKLAEFKMLARIRQQAVLAELSHHALAGNQVAELLERAVQRVAEVLEVNHALVLECEKDELLWRAGTGWPEGLLGKVRESQAPNAQMGYVMEMGQPVIVASLRDENRFTPSPMLLEQGLQSCLSAAIGARVRPYGLLGAFCAEPDQFTQEDSDFLQSVANIVAMAIERSERETTIQELSTPVLEIAVGTLLVPVVGHLDAPRAARMEGTLLKAIRDRRARVVLLDLTGTTRFDSQVAERFRRMLAAAQLLGARVLISGISSNLAKTLAGLGSDTAGLATVGDLRSGIEEAVRLLSDGREEWSVLGRHARRGGAGGGRI